MGVHSLSTFVEKRNLGSTISISTASPPCVFIVDGLAFLYSLRSCVSILGGDYWEARRCSFRRVIDVWRNLSITAIFVFDGPSFPSSTRHR